MINTFIECSLHSTDLRISEDKPITPAFLIAALLWHPIQHMFANLQSEGIPAHPAFDQASREVLNIQRQTLNIPKRLSRVIREIWILQNRMKRHSGTRVFSVLGHPRFRAAYDFLLLRAQCGDCSQDLANWWTKFYNADHDSQLQMINQTKKPKRRRKPKS